jgi:hypothetical protein
MQRIETNVKSLRGKTDVKLQWLADNRIKYKLSKRLLT